MIVFLDFENSIYIVHSGSFQHAIAHLESAAHHGTQKNAQSNAACEYLGGRGGCFWRETTSLRREPEIIREYLMDPPNLLAKSMFKCDIPFEKLQLVQERHI